ENGRVRESEWRGAMLRLRDSIVPCAHCQAENFYDEPRSNSQNAVRRCWNCRQELILPVRISIGKHLIMLNADTELYQFHTDPGATPDLNKVVASISRHPTKPNIWGLK